MKKVKQVSSIFTARDVGISTRMITYWEEKGLLRYLAPDYQHTHGEYGWRKFSLREVVNIQMANKLRKLGFEHKLIKKIICTK